MTKPASGSSGMRVTIALTSAAPAVVDARYPFSSSKLVGLHGAPVAVVGDHDRQADGDLGGGERDDEEREDRAGARSAGRKLVIATSAMLTALSMSSRLMTMRIDVAPRQHAEGADAEEQRGEQQLPVESASSPLILLLRASRIAPTMAASSTSETSSKGST